MLNILKKYLTKNPCYTANVNKADSRYVDFQKYGAWGLMLHSVGCAQPSAEVFYNRWNKETYSNACVHAFIDANTGDVWQTLPWNYRGWHCAGSGNNTHIGVEMCESAYIKYTSSTKFEVVDRTKAVADCVRAYHSAVALFAMLCEQLGLTEKDILSHKEGYYAGIATNHGDPEHYWKGLGMKYTMDGFREDVKKAMSVEEGLNSKQVEDVKDIVYDKLDTNFGKYIETIDDVHVSLRGRVRKLLDEGIINAGTVDNKDDIRMREDLLRVVCIADLMIERRMKELVTRILESFKEG